MSDSFLPGDNASELGTAVDPLRTRLEKVVREKSLLEADLVNSNREKARLEDELATVTRRFEKELLRLEDILRETMISFQVSPQSELEEVLYWFIPQSIKKWIKERKVAEDILYLQNSKSFNSTWYLAQNSDVAANGSDAATHYVLHGEKEGRQPSPDFKPSLQRPVDYANQPFAGSYYVRYLKNSSPIRNGYLAAAKAKSPSSPALEILDEPNDLFVGFKNNRPIDPSIKLIAFYLPQFHAFPENDLWWGKGFTEWTNVCKARPNFTGHYQPHFPIHFGYYDLRVAEVMVEQAKLAKSYGLSGFSFYFYWFAGKTLMERPLEMLLENQDVDLPFCLTWANENWTRRWDGMENDILIAQNHTDEDSLAFIRHLVKYFKDSRYIRVDDKPVLIVYRPAIIPEMDKVIRLWREEIVKHGFKGIYLVCVQGFGFENPDQFGFDAAVEFPPHGVDARNIATEVENVNPKHQGRVYSYESAVDSFVERAEPSFKLFPATMLSWDNTARNQNKPHTFTHFSLSAYRRWLSAACSRVFCNPKYKADEKLVFINAWNEWAEGTHLEPDRKYGYGYLQSTYDVIEDYDRGLRDDTAVEALEETTDTEALGEPSNVEGLLLPFSFNNFSIGPFENETNLAVIIHIFYLETAAEILRNLHFIPVAYDLFITTDTEAKKAEITELLRSLAIPLCEIRIAPNRGRDIAPKYITFRDVYERYEFFLHFHSKRTIKNPEHGARWRKFLLKTLVGSRKSIFSILHLLSDPQVGIVYPTSPFSLTNHRWGENLSLGRTFLQRMNIEISTKTLLEFPAGSMYWGRSASLRPLLDLHLTFEDFPEEMGQVDGTIAHVIERSINLIAKKAGFAAIQIAPKDYISTEGPFVSVQSDRQLKTLIKVLASNNNNRPA